MCRGRRIGDLAVALPFGFSGHAHRRQELSRANYCLEAIVDWAERAKTVGYPEWFAQEALTWLPRLKRRAFFSTPVSRAGPGTRCGGMKLLIWRTGENLLAVGRAVVFVLMPCTMQELVRSSGGPFLNSKDSAVHPGPYRNLPRWEALAGRILKTQRHDIVQALMRPLLVGMIFNLPEHVSQMAFTQEDQLVQRFPCFAHKPFRVGVAHR